MTEAHFKFDAFISYRRTDGRHFAGGLRRRLQTYRLPERLAVGRKEPLSIYLDTIYERAANDFFEQTIVPALRDSRFLIVVHTPSTLLSRSDGSQNWVEREIDFFQSLPQGKNIAIAVPAGDYEGPLAANLHITFPNVQRVNMRQRGLGFSESDRLLQFIATIHDIPEAEMPTLRLEEERRKKRLWAGRFAFTMTILAILTALVVWLLFELRRSRSLQLAAEARNALPKRMDIALAKAAEAESLRDTPQAQAALLAAFSTSPHLAGFVRVPSIPTAGAISPGGERVALAYGKKVSFWRTEDLSRETLSWNTGTNRIEQVVFNPSESYVAAMDDHSIHLYDLNAGNGFTLFQTTTSLAAIQFQADTGALIAVDRTPALLKWQPSSFSSGARPETNLLQPGVTRFLLATTGLRIASFDLANGRASVTALDQGTGHQAESFQSPNDFVNAAFVGPNDFVAAAYGPVLTFGAGFPPKTIAEDAAHRFDSPVASNGRWAAYATESNSVVVRQVPEGQNATALLGHTHNVYGLSFGGPEGSLLLSRGDIRPKSTLEGPSYGAILWDFSRPHPLARQLSRVEVYRPVLTADEKGQMLACTAVPGQVSVWRLASGEASELKINVSTEGAIILRLRLNSNGHLAGVTEDRRIIAWDLSSEKPLISGPENGNILDLAISKAGAPLTFDMNGRVIEWLRSSNQVVKGGVWDVPGGADAESAAFSRSGEVLIWLKFNHLHIWRFGSKSSREIPLESGSDTLRSVALSADGERGCIVLESGLRFFGIRSGAFNGQPLDPLDYSPSGLPNPISSAVMSANLKFIASSSQQGSTTLLWNRATGQVIGELPTGDVDRESLVFLTSGRFASVSRDRGLLLWDLRPKEWGAIARRAVASEER